MKPKKENQTKFLCYPKKYVLFDVFLVLLFLFVATLSWYAIEFTSFTVQVAWSGAFGLTSMFFVFKLLDKIQHVTIDQNKVVLTNCFGEIKTLDTKRCYFYVQKLKTLGLFAGEWICIYASTNKKFFGFFAKGRQNKGKFDRIQFFATQDRLNAIANLLHQGNKGITWAHDEDNDDEDSWKPKA